MTLDKISLYTIIVCLCSFCGSMYAQSVPADNDADIAVYENLLDDYNRSGNVGTANEICKMLYKYEFTDSLVVFDKNCSEDFVKANILYLSGEYFHYNQQYDKSVSCALEAYSLLQKGNDKYTQGDCANLIAILYFRKSDYANAIKYAKSGYELYKEVGDKSRVSSSLNTIAGICLASQQFKEGEKYILKAIDNSREANDSARLAIQCGMASELYHNMELEEQALYYAKTAYEIDNALGNRQKVAIRLSQLATVSIAMKNYPEAEKSLKEAIEILQKAGNNQSYAICCNQMGSVMLAQKNKYEAYTYFSKALEIFKSKGDLYNESKASFGLYQTLEASIPAEAIKHLYRYSLLKDTLYSRDMQRELSLHNAKFKNDELKLENEKEQIEKKIILVILILVVGISVMVILMMLYKRRLRIHENKLQKELQNTKDNFFANITHEFRTPLTVIESAAESIRKDSVEGSETFRDAVNITRHGNALLDLINQILDITKMTSAAEFKPHWRKGDIVAFVAMECECYRKFAASCGITIVYKSQEESLDIDFIPDYMNKILKNLISNAIKYSGSDTEILLSSNVENGKFKLYVCDSGRGISPDKLKNIFKPFYQAHDDNINMGTGIGLSLVKLAVEAMDGTIEAHSQEGVGSVFILEMPIARKSAGVAQIDAEELDEFKSEKEVVPETKLEDDDLYNDDAIRVLIVEDEQSIAKYEARQLNKNYKYYFAADGIDGLAKAEDIMPDIIISDVLMPGIDGYELCRKIRESELMSHIPVIMVTAKISHEDKIRGLEAGADAYLEKPFREDELNVRVEKLLEQRQMLREKFNAAVEEGEEDIADLKTADREFLDKFVALVMKQFKDRAIDLEKIASELCITKAQMNRKIKAIAGMNSTTYIMNVRVGMAKALLKSGKNLSINDISLMCGIEDVSYFITMFKKITGLTPKQFLQKNK